MIAFYISAHGYGHAARSLPVIEALLQRQRVLVVSRVPARFFQGKVEVRERSFDVGLVQVDSVRGDVPATLRLCQELMAHEAELLAEEEDFLRERGVHLVVTDSPALPLTAARRCGIPGLLLASFGWDYIYQPFVEEDPAWQTICEWFRGHYANAIRVLRYPFAAPMPNCEEMPLVARPGRSRREALARQTGADLGHPWVLLWFHQLEIDPAWLQTMPYEFFVLPGLDWSGPNCHQVSGDNFSDLVASVEVVVSKPGFGIVSDCIANEKPLVYVPRTDFSEAFLLEAAIQRHLRHVRLETEDAYSGNWGPAIDAALRDRRPVAAVPVDGAGFIADRILSFFPPLHR